MGSDGTPWSSSPHNPDGHLRNRYLIKPLASIPELSDYAIEIGSFGDDARGRRGEPKTRPEVRPVLIEPD
jgi:hypothetical protein